MHSEILKPVVVLAAWTMIMWLWMYATRLPAMGKSNLDVKNWVGGTGKDLDAVLPAKTQWIAQNYNHLHEQPTVFYAVALALAFMGSGNTLNAWIAWAYVALRIVHSIFQSTVNRVAVRFVIFLLSSLCLMALTLHAVVIAFAR
jgi:hypothetical protein